MDYVQNEISLVADVSETERIELAREVCVRVCVCPPLIEKKTYRRQYRCDRSYLATHPIPGEIVKQWFTELKIPAPLVRQWRIESGEHQLTGLSGETVSSFAACCCFDSVISTSPRVQSSHSLSPLISLRSAGGNVFSARSSHRYETRPFKFCWTRLSRSRNTFEFSTVVVHSENRTKEDLERNPRTAEITRTLPRTINKYLLARDTTWFLLRHSTNLCRVLWVIKRLIVPRRTRNVLVSTESRRFGVVFPSGFPPFSFPSFLLWKTPREKFLLLGQPEVGY